MDFNVTTDYPIDQYVLYKTGSLTVAGSGAFSVLNIAHGLPFIPLIYAQWSYTSDFSTPREFFQNSGDTYSVGEPFILRSSAGATDVTIDFQNWGSSSRTLYFRVWGFQPSTSNASTSFTSSLSGLSDYTLNTDMNYLKLHQEGVINVPATTNGVINHNLGYLPVVMVWQQWNLTPVTVEPLFSPYASTLFFGDMSPYVTSTSIVFPPNGYSISTYHYRIYMDRIDG